MFYEKMINGMNICDAFIMAKAVVEFQYKPKEADLFIKYTSEQKVEFDEVFPQKAAPHVCYSHSKAPAGQYKCISDHIQFKQIPNKLANLKFREKEVSKLTESVMSGNRLVIMLGLHGTGKSTIVRQALHYMCDRKYFTGGVIQI